MRATPTDTAAPLTLRTGRPVRAAFALAEVMIATAITAISAAALLTSIASSTATGDWALRHEIARGLAEQLMAEVAAAPLPALPDPPPTGGGGGGYDGGYGGGSGGGCRMDSASGRVAFCDVDAFDGWTARPPRTPCGSLLGTDGAANCSETGYGPVYTRETAGQANAALLSSFERTIGVDQIESDGTGGWHAGDADSRYRRITVRVLYHDRSGAAHTLQTLVRIVSDVP